MTACYESLLENEINSDEVAPSLVQWEVISGWCQIGWVSKVRRFTIFLTEEGKWRVDFYDQKIKQEYSILSSGDSAEEGKRFCEWVARAYQEKAN